LAPDIRLIAVDLDGTLLDPQNRVSEADAAAVRDAVAAGIAVVFATSRWHQAALRTATALGLEGYIISHNGALVRSTDGASELVHHRIDVALARELAAHIDGLVGDAYVTLDDRTFVRSKRLRDPSRLPPDMALTESLGAVVTAAPTAFLLFGPEAVRSTVERFREHHGTGLNLAEGFSESFPDYLNVVHARADKGSALIAVCQALGVGPHETMALGDAAPDIAMIKVAGVGVAMGNAAPDVKAAAAFVAPPNSDSGVAWAVRRFALAR
jgi:hydroxymethylpyrimidine pyrophosphatase-like HAD family hydrolase